MNDQQPTIETLLLDIFGNVVGNKLTDGDKERMLRSTLELLIAVHRKLDRIEKKIERLKDEQFN